MAEFEKSISKLKLESDGEYLEMMDAINDWTYILDSDTLQEGIKEKLVETVIEGLNTYKRMQQLFIAFTIIAEKE